jgi:GH18 family chitinase
MMQLNDRKDRDTNCTALWVAASRQSAAICSLTAKADPGGALPRRRYVGGLRALLCFLLLAAPCSRADLRITAYYPGYKQSSMPASEIDFSVVTHLIHFSVVPDPDGTLNAGANGITPARSADVVSRAHAAGRPVLICVGGSNSQSGFQGATSPANLPSFTTNLITFMSTNSYDGIDIDWEPLPSSDFNQFTNLVISLRSALRPFPQAKLLTIAAAPYPPYPDFSDAQYVMYESIQNLLDQINLMTYDLSGPYAGWVTWFNSPIYDGGASFPNGSRKLPSIDVPVNSFLSNGVAPSKLGLGTPYYGMVWRGGAGTPSGGVTQPRQSWTNAPTTTAVTFSTILSTYYQSNLYHWDNAAQAAYLSVTNAVSTNDEFISFDDQHSTATKVSYARNHALGGLMIWELSQDYQAAAPQGQRHPLLQSVEQALATPGLVAIQSSNQDIHLSFPTAPLGLYRVLAATNLSGPSWITLTNNLPGNSNGVATSTVLDLGALRNQPQRFYRVQTPP